MRAEVAHNELEKEFLMSKMHRLWAQIEYVTTSARELATLIDIETCHQPYSSLSPKIAYEFASVTRQVLRAAQMVVETRAAENRAYTRVIQNAQHNIQGLVKLADREIILLACIMDQLDIQMDSDPGSEEGEEGEEEVGVAEAVVVALFAALAAATAPVESGRRRPPHAG